jgi:cysteine desulfurase
MYEFRKEIAALGKFALHGPNNDDSSSYHVIFTSGASEANCFMLRSCAEAYWRQTGKIGHMIISAIEHKSLLECAEQLAKNERISLTMLKPDQFGFIGHETLKAAMRADTCLVSVMTANNETGAINNIKVLGAIAHSANVPFHTDATQSYGKFGMAPNLMNVDAFTISFHKLHGPTGIGALIIKDDLWTGYSMQPMICGSQNDHMRGGTENIIGIAAARIAFARNFTSRSNKNAKLLALKNMLIDGIRAKMHTVTYLEYLEAYHGRAPKTHLDVEIVIIATSTPLYCQTQFIWLYVRRDAFVTWILKTRSRRAILLFQLVVPVIRQLRTCHRML